jgi:long-subunit fatty acid transport protein
MHLCLSKNMWNHLKSSIDSKEMNTGEISMNFQKVIMIVSGALGAQVMAAGYDQAVPFSGRYGGIAGAASSHVSGGESLVFNPAGLAGLGDYEKGDVSANFSPTFLRTNAPVVARDQNYDSDVSTAHRFGVFASHQMGSMAAVGLGVSTVGGAESQFNEVDLTSINANHSGFFPKYGMKMSVLEYALGGGVKFGRGFKMGAAWRVSQINAEYDFIQPYNNVSSGAYLGAISANMRLKQTDWRGYRLGIQWAEPEHQNYGVGITYRSAVKMDLKGAAVGRFDAASGVPTVDMTGSSARASGNAFPQQLVLGTHYQVLEKRMRVYAEYSWTQYSVNHRMNIDGALGLPSSLGTPVSVGINSLAQDWKDQHQVRVATDYKPHPDYIVRGGYSYTSQVTPKTTADAMSTPPAAFHDFTFGAGWEHRDWTLNAALDLGYGQGDTEAPQFGNGQIWSKSVALHTGIDYRF